MIGAGFQEQVFKTEFSNTLTTLPQQTKARLWGVMPVVPITAEESMIDTIGVLEAYINNDKYAKPNPQELNFARRRVDTDSVHVDVNIDPKYNKQALMDPLVQGKLAEQALAAMERAFDQIAYSKLFADVQYGRRGENTATFAQDGGTVLDFTGGWTYAQWIALMRHYAKKEIGMEETNKVILGVTDEEQATFLQTEELMNTFYGNTFTAQKGPIGFTEALGFKITTYGSDPDYHDPLLTVSGGERTCYGIATDGMIGVIRENVMVDVVELKESSYRTMQLRVSADIGCVRRLGSHILQIQSVAA